MATSVVNDVFGKEELIISGVVTGTLEQYKDQLNSLGDVDVRGVKQRTLLYVAVGLGKVDWVEGLLERGANPGLSDVEGVSVIELAKGMAEKYPENEDRQSISSQDAGMEAMGQGMISVLSRKMASMCESMNDIQSRMDTLREEVTTNRNLINEEITTNRDLINDVKTEMATINTQAMQEMSTIRNLINEEMSTNRDLINDVKTEMATINTHAMQEISTIRNSIDDVKTGMATVGNQREETEAIRNFVDDVKTGITTINTHLQEMSTIRNSIDDVKTGITTINTHLQEMSTIRNSIDDVKTGITTINTHLQEMSTIRNSIDDVKTGITTINTHLQEMSTIRNSIDDVKAELAARDVLLSALESSVTSLANRERPVGMTPESSTVDEEVLPSTPRKEEDIRRECVEAMMRKTNILRSYEGKVTKAERMYEKIYYECDETACLLKFLKSHDDVSVVIGFDSVDIGGMKSRFTDHDGVERKGHLHDYFADFEEKKVYLAEGNGDENWTIGCLAGALAQMSVCLAFNNGGRPYAAGDDVTERRMKNALKEAEEEYRRNGVDWIIRDALEKETQRKKEVYLTSAVPLIIARDGSTEGTSLMQPRFPLLLELFRDSVMPALLSKAQV